MNTPHYSSWQKMRKELRALVAPSLAGRIDYMATRYRKAHDALGHAEILVDGHSVTSFCCYREMVREYREPDDYARGIKDFCEHDFIAAAGLHLNSPVQDGLAGVDDVEREPGLRHRETAVLRRCLALVDKRIGKRSLRRIAGELEDAPALVRYFAALRLEAEGIPFDFEVPECVIP